MFLYAFRLEVFDEEEEADDPLLMGEELDMGGWYIVVEEIVEGVGGFENGQAFIEVDKKLALNFFQDLVLQIYYLKHFI